MEAILTWLRALAPSWGKEEHDFRNRVNAKENFMGRRIFLAALGIALAAMSSMERSVCAGPIGTQAFVDIGSPSANTGNINTATSFKIGDLLSTSSSSGVFTGLSTQNLGSVSFNVAVPGSLTFGNSVFGTFTSTSFSLLTQAPGTIAYYVSGDWTPGTYVGGSGTDAASFTISFTQTPAHTGSISDSATFSVPPASIPVGPQATPEPASLVMGLTAASALGLVSLYRRRSRRVAA